MEFIETKNGLRTVKIDNKFMHSKYDPIKEGLKFIEQQKIDKDIIIVLGAGLGYLYTILGQKYPDKQIIGLPYSSELGKISLEINPTKRIQWNREIDLSQFLNKNITVFNISKIQLMFWEPSSLAFETESKEILEQLSRHIRRINGNLLTTARFGKIWIKNSISNYLNTSEYISNISIQGAIVIVAPGSSLEKSIPYLIKYRDKITLFSLSSAVLALKSYGIIPDLIFSTDPGYYSKLHLSTLNAPLAMPLANSTSKKSSVLLINQGNFYENEIINMSKLPSYYIPENGTVAGTALDFAIKHTNSSIYLLGQDLESSDLKTHISPYAFDTLLQQIENKTSPFYSIMYKRWKDSGITYKTYRDWYTAYGTKHKIRIKRSSPGTAQISPINELSLEQLENDLKQLDHKSTIVYDFIDAGRKDERYKKINKLLLQWIQLVENEKTNWKELIYLISTEKSTDDNIKTNFTEGKLITVEFLKRLLSLYARKIL